ncbi:hypothetical protein CRYUN_Cryun40dG0088600 [Craigia yunnanensis]
MSAKLISCGVILFHDSNLMDMYRKIGKGEFKFPDWFCPEVCRLLSKILDPNPSTRISLAKVMDNPWFRKGLDPKAELVDAEVKEPAPLNADTVFNLNGSNANVVEERKQKKEVRFTSNKEERWRIVENRRL